MGEPARKHATYQDVLDAPDDQVTELVHGVLHTSPRPRSIHSRASASMMGALHGPFDRGRGGPGGWIFLDEPELHLGEHVLVPDLAGWRRERMPELPDVPFLTVPPSWVCEVLSPSTAAFDRGEKLPIYAQQGVSFAWLVDPAAQTLEIFKLDGATWRVIATHSGEEVLHAEPFEALEFQLGELWSK